MCRPPLWVACLALVALHLPASEGGQAISSKESGLAAGDWPNLKTLTSSNKESRPTDQPPSAGFPRGQESPRQTNQRKGQNEKFMNFAHFCEFWCFSLGEQARFTLNFCSGMPLRKVHELTFLWFGLPGPLLKRARGLRKLG